jgi:4-amino-4-deoxy-L-arabinose transferase-like glycosyltransferase
LPRAALLLFCLAYLLPGFIDRAPWRSADISAFGVMAELARGSTDWLSPRLAGMSPDVDALLPYWLGAWALKLAPGWIPPDLAARLPFIGLLALTFIAIWQGIYYLARSPLAQPVAFAFGGEAQVPDYARAMADGGLLAFIACLGLAQLSHETTPALAQLSFTALGFYAVAAMPYRRVLPAIAASVALLGLTLSGAPSMAVLLGAGSAVIHWLDRNHDLQSRAQHLRGLLLLIALTALAAALSTVLHLWRWRIELPALNYPVWHGLASLLLWFTWPAWPLVLWTLWRWRRQVLSRHLRRHLALPLWFALVTVGATLLTSAGDRALLLSLPALATLAAFALPTLERSVAALIDWFTLLFFTTCALVIWVVWIAMQTGFPPQPAANVARLAPGFEPRFVILPFVFATLATIAWGWLVKWRAGRHRAAIWKSLVLPAGGAALCWLLLTTLWMPLLDHARSYAPLVRRVEAVVKPSPCIETFGLRQGLMAAFQFHSNLRLEPATDRATCQWLLVDGDLITHIPEIVSPAKWVRHSSLGHPREGEEDIVIYQRIAGKNAP